MRSKFLSNHLPLMALVLGAAAGLTRLGLYAFGVDEKGLLLNGHLFSLLTWALTVCSAGVFCLGVVKLGGSDAYNDNFAPSAAAALGCLALAAGIAATVLSGWDTWLGLERIRNFLGLTAVPALLLAAFYRNRGEQPFFLLWALPCLYLTLHTVSHYQLWCSRPQFQDFFFSMASSILMTLFAYYQTAFSVGFGKRRMLLGVGLTGSFACLAALAGGEDVWLYLGGALWMITNLCRLIPVPKKEEIQ